MRVAKKVMAVALAAAMTVSMLTACGGTGYDAATAKFGAKVEQA